MTLKVALTAGFVFIADGTSTIINFDLLKDPWSPGAVAFTERKANFPTGVSTLEGIAGTVTLAGSILTLTCDTAPPAGPTSFAVYLTFG